MSTTKKRILAYLIMALSLIITIKLIKDILRLKTTDQRLIEAQEELMLAQKEQVELKQELKEVEDKDWWERQIRNVLKMARPEEIVVVVPEEVTNQVNSPHFAEATRGENLTNFQKWWQVFNN